MRVVSRQCYNSFLDKYASDQTPWAADELFEAMRRVAAASWNGRDSGEIPQIQRIICGNRN